MIPNSIGGVIFRRCTASERLEGSPAAGPRLWLDPNGPLTRIWWRSGEFEGARLVLLQIRAVSPDRIGGRRSRISSRRWRQEMAARTRYPPVSDRSQLLGAGRENPCVGQAPAAKPAGNPSPFMQLGRTSRQFNVRRLCVGLDWAPDWHAWSVRRSNSRRRSVIPRASQRTGRTRKSSSANYRAGAASSGAPVLPPPATRPRAV
jgi:hypothetical protein